MNEEIKAGMILQSYGGNININAEDTADNLHFFTTNENRILIKYHTDIDKIEWREGSDWIDLRAAEDVELKKDEYKLISLGVSMKLPDGYEAHIAPRSSSFKNFWVIQTNSVGVVDNSYSGDNDIWMFPALAKRDTIIHKNDRICQFRLVKKMKPVSFIEVESLDNKNRGGFGSTGIS